MIDTKNMQRLAVCFATVLIAGCGGGTGGSGTLSGNAIAPAASGVAGPTQAGEPAPAPSPPATAAPPPPGAPAGVTVAAFSVAASGVTQGLAQGSVAVAADGNAWFSGGEAPSAIGRITPAGAVSYPVTGDVAAGTFNAGPLIVGPDGNIWFCDPFDGTELRGSIATIDVATGVSTKYRPTLGITAGSQVYAIALGSDGNLWFSEINGNRIGMFDVVSKTAIEYGPLLSPATSIASGPDAAVWFSETLSASSSILGRIAIDGTITEFTDSAIDGTIAAIATGPDGMIWFIKNGFGGPGIGKMDPMTGVVTVYSTGFVGASTQLGSIVAGGDGKLWFTDYYDGLLGRITTDGTIVEFASGSSSQQINAIAAGGSKRLWFSNPGEDSIGLIGLP